MEAIKQFTDRAVPLILQQTRDCFTPLLAANRVRIAETPKKTFKYGQSERHLVDIYYPPPGTLNAPVLFFVYGGAFRFGARDVVPGLVFDGLGAFFAQRGILTAIPDYRLAPGTTYPGAAHDLRDAVRFVLTSPEAGVARDDDGGGGGGGADAGRVFLFGHSAGGTHVLTMLLNEDILLHQARDMFRGAILMSPAYGADAFLSVYYGDAEEDQAANCPNGLVKSKSDEKLKELLPPRICLLTSERDDPTLKGWDDTFRQSLRDKGIADFDEYVLMGHNHISPEVTLFSGEGEEWGEYLVQWIKAA